MSLDEEAPSWFRSSLAEEARTHRLDVGGTTIEARAWGDPAAPAVVVLHGGAAHARWWDPLAPLLASGHHVLAPDLSGHGDSGRRRAYSVGAWADEVEALLDGLVDGPVLVVGHSMGGFVAVEVALRRSWALRGLVVLDCELTPRGRVPRGPEDADARARTRRLYQDEATILRRFRLLPEGASIPAWMLEHVSRHSVTRRPDGWTWKFDPAFFAHDFLHLEDLRPLDCPVAIVRGDRGLVSADLAADTARSLGNHALSLVVHDSGHHVLLEQPLQVATLVQTLDGVWSGLPTRSARADVLG